MEPLRLPCKRWKGKFRKDGYGYAMVNGRAVLGHRHVYIEATGDSPEEVHHRCHNRWCVELEHLQPITRAEHRRLHTKTHCKHGHEYTPASTYITPRTGARSCLICRQYRNRKQKSRWIGNI